MVSFYSENEKKLKKNERTENSETKVCNFIKNVFSFSDIDEYIDSGFLALQRSIDKAYIEIITEQQNRDEFKVWHPKLEFPIDFQTNIRI